MSSPVVVQNVKYLATSHVAGYMAHRNSSYAQCWELHGARRL